MGHKLNKLKLTGNIDQRKIYGWTARGMVLHTKSLPGNMVSTVDMEIQRNMVLWIYNNQTLGCFIWLQVLQVGNIDTDTLWPHAVSSSDTAS